MNANNTSIVMIMGRTRDGRTFRPSDWAQRLALSASAGTCPVDRPMCFHPRVHIGDVGGVTAVMIDRELEREDPALFGFLMAFANQNNLECTDGTGAGPRAVNQN